MEPVANFTSPCSKCTNISTKANTRDDDEKMNVLAVNVAELRMNFFDQPLNSGDLSQKKTALKLFHSHDSEALLIALIDAHF